MFVIRLPPLRERLDDIAALAEHFAAARGAAVRRRGAAASRRAIWRCSRAYAWPGNVRELAAVIERAAILGEGKRLDVERALGVRNEAPVAAAAATAATAAPAAMAAPAAAADGNDDFPTLEAATRAHIERALVRCQGRIEGPGGAAQLPRPAPEHAALEDEQARRALDGVPAVGRADAARGRAARRRHGGEARWAHAGGARCASPLGLDPRRSLQRCEALASFLPGKDACRSPSRALPARARARTRSSACIASSSVSIARRSPKLCLAVRGLHREDVRQRAHAPARDAASARAPRAAHDRRARLGDLPPGSARLPRAARASRPRERLGRRGRRQARARSSGRAHRRRSRERLVRISPCSGAMAKAASTAWNLGSTVQQVLAVTRGSVLIARSSPGAPGVVIPKRILVPARWLAPHRERAADGGAHREHVTAPSCCSSTSSRSPSRARCCARGEDLELATRARRAASRPRRALPGHAPRSAGARRRRRADARHPARRTSGSASSSSRSRSRSISIVLSAHGAACDPARPFGSVTAHLLDALERALARPAGPSATRARSDARARGAARTAAARELSARGHVTAAVDPAPRDRRREDRCPRSGRPRARRDPARARRARTRALGRVRRAVARHARARAGAAAPRRDPCRRRHAAEGRRVVPRQLLPDPPRRATGRRGAAPGLRAPPPAARLGSREGRAADRDAGARRSSARSRIELDVIAVRRFVDAYQEVSPLTIAELWALPTMLRASVLRTCSGSSIELARSRLRGERRTAKRSRSIPALGVERADAGAAPARRDRLEDVLRADESRRGHPARRSGGASTRGWTSRPAMRTARWSRSSPGPPAAPSRTSPSSRSRSRASIPRTSAAATSATT